MLQLQKRDTKEIRFLRLYRVVQEREKTLSKEAKIVQYGAILRYFMKFLQQKEHQPPVILTILYQVTKKLGDICYEDALQEHTNTQYFLAAGYYNQALGFAQSMIEKSNILTALKEVYYYLDDNDALVKVEQAWAENHLEKDKFSAFMLLAKQTIDIKTKAAFLARALDEVMAQDESFYTKYQDTLDVCSQLSVLYELLNEKSNVARVNELREKTLKLLN